MRVKKELLATYNGHNIFMIMLYNDIGAMVNIINYGAIIKDILIPGLDNVPYNQVLSYDTVEEYYSDPHYLGCIVGRYANRISGGQLNINGNKYFLSINEVDNNNHLHGGFQGFNKKVWDVGNTFSTVAEAGVTLSAVSTHLEEGYPGNLKVDVTYTLSNSNELIIKYNATTDQPTVINLTNHSYFNLSAGVRDISSYLLSINADEYTPANQQYIPDGRIQSVDNSIFDLRSGKRVGDFMHTIDTANYCLNNKKEFKLAATLTDPLSNRRLEVRTTNPGLQLYCGNYLSGKFKPFSGICLEPHYYPDSPNRPQFPSSILLPGEVYQEATSYTFL